MTKYTIHPLDNVSRFHFRAWSGKKMYYSWDANVVFAPAPRAVEFRGALVAGFNGPNGPEFFDTPPMQSTGLVDASGHEIYESDILRYDGNGYEIEWDHVEALYVGLSDTTDNSPLELSVIASTSNVVGNIHEGYSPRKTPQ